MPLHAEPTCLLPLSLPLALWGRSAFAHRMPVVAAGRPWQVFLSQTVFSQLRAPKLAETVGLQHRLLAWICRYEGAVACLWQFHDALRHCSQGLRPTTCARLGSDAAVPCASLGPADPFFYPPDPIPI